MVKIEKVKGMRDYETEDMVLRRNVVAMVEKIFEARGFVPIETPALEKWDVLAGKDAGGRDILEQTFNFLDQGDRRVGLRYDLTVPLVRYVSERSNMGFPFKRYQYGRVWRYEETRKGRYREFYQFDIDIVGAGSVAADAECIATITEALGALGVGKFKVLISNRKVAEGVLNFLGIKTKKQVDGAMRTIDKAEKLSRANLIKEFKQYDIVEAQAIEIINALSRKGRPVEVIRSMLKEFPDNDKVLLGISELEKLVDYLNAYGVTDRCELDLSLVRGLGYYTGCVFEARLDKGGDSIAGGGRYDKVIGSFTSREIPAVGFSLGIERILNILKEKDYVKRPLVEYFVLYAGAEMEFSAIKIAEALRAEGRIAEVDLMGRNFSGQMKYADRIGALKVVIVGQKEMASGNVVVKDMKSGKELIVAVEGILGV
ncbi:MAG: histidine--tRNA ligase [archaeon]